MAERAAEITASYPISYPAGQIECSKSAISGRLAARALFSPTPFACKGGEETGANSWIRARGRPHLEHSYGSAFAGRFRLRTSWKISLGEEFTQYTTKFRANADRSRCSWQPGQAPTTSLLQHAHVLAFFRANQPNLCCTRARLDAFFRSLGVEPFIAVHR